MNVLVCMVIRYIRPMMNHEVRLLGCYDSPSSYFAWTLNPKRILSLTEINMRL